MRALTAPLTGLVLVSSVALAACGSNTRAPAASGDVVSCSYPASGQAAKKVSTPPKHAPASGTTKLTITLNAGAVPVTLDDKAAPCTVNSFTSLARQKYFDATPCHRLVTAGIFVLQCGDPSGTGSGGPGYSFADELSSAQALKDAPQSGGEAKTYPAGTLAMANAGPDTNGSQFFIVYADSPLPPAYTVFGTVSAAGLGVVKAIAAKGTADGSGDGAPKTAVKIQSVS